MREINKNINFFKLVSEDFGRTIETGKRFNLILPCVSAAVLVVAAWIVLSLLTSGVENEISLIMANMGVTRADGETRETDVLDVIIAQRAYAQDSKFSSSLLKEVFTCQPQDLQILDAVYSNGTITFNCFSERELCGADFARLLRELPEFGKIDYSGISKSGEGYGFTVSAVIAAGEW